MCEFLSDTLSSAGITDCMCVSPGAKYCSESIDITINNFNNIIGYYDNRTIKFTEKKWNVLCSLLAEFKMVTTTKGGSGRLSNLRLRRNNADSVLVVERRISFYSRKDPGGGLGVRLSGLHVFCRLGEGV